MYRQYREGELPDIQIKYSELIRPLQALAQVCVGVVVCGYGCECECVGGLCVYLCVRVTVHSGETVQYNHILLVWSLCMVVYIAESLQSMKFTE